MSRFAGTEGEQWFMQTVDQEISITVIPIKPVDDDDVMDVFRVSVSHTAIKLVAKAIDTDTYYMVKDRRAKIGANQGSVYMKIKVAD